MTPLPLMIQALHYHHVRKVYLFGVELTGESL